MLISIIEINNIPNGATMVLKKNDSDNTYELSTSRKIGDVVFTDQKDRHCYTDFNHAVGIMMLNVPNLLREKIQWY